MIEDMGVSIVMGVRTPIAGWFIENPKHKWLITAGTPITKRKAPWEYHLMNIWLVVWNVAFICPCIGNNNPN